jgi:hypothetical protein
MDQVSAGLYVRSNERRTTSAGDRYPKNGFSWVENFQVNAIGDNDNLSTPVNSMDHVHFGLAFGYHHTGTTPDGANKGGQEGIQVTVTAFEAGDIGTGDAHQVRQTSEVRSIQATPPAGTALQAKHRS